MLDYFGTVGCCQLHISSNSAISKLGAGSYGFERLRKTLPGGGHLRPLGFLCSAPKEHAFWIILGLWDVANSTSAQIQLFPNLGQDPTDLIN